MNDQGYKASSQVALSSVIAVCGIMAASAQTYTPDLPDSMRYKMQQFHQGARAFEIESENRIATYNSRAERLLIGKPEWCDENNHPSRWPGHVRAIPDSESIVSMARDNGTDFDLRQDRVRRRASDAKSFNNDRCGAVSDVSTFLTCDTNRTKLVVDEQTLIELDTLAADRSKVTMSAIRALKCYAIDDPEARKFQLHVADMLRDYLNQTLRSARCLDKATIEMTPLPTAAANGDPCS